MPRSVRPLSRQTGRGGARSIWSCRAKLEAVEAGIAVFEEEFMAFIVVPGLNQTIGEIMVPRLSTGEFDVSRLLPLTEVP